MSSSLPLTLLLPALACLPLASSDFRRRRVGVRGLLLLGAVSLLVSIVGYPFALFLLHTLANSALLLFLLLFLYLYFRLRHGIGMRSFGYYFGAGDVFFMVSVAPLFAPEGFVRFLVISCVLSLVWWYFLRPRRRSTVPFAGMMGLTLVLLTMLQLLGLWTR